MLLCNDVSSSSCVLYTYIMLNITTYVYICQGAKEKGLIEVF